MISFSTLLKVAIVALFIQIPTWLDQRDTKVLLKYPKPPVPEYGRVTTIQHSKATMEKVASFYDQFSVDDYASSYDMYYEAQTENCNSENNLVVVSGTNGATYLYWDLIDHFRKQGYCTLNYDYRSHGRSSAAPGIFTAELLGEDSAAIIKKVFPGKQVHLVGLSLGGAVSYYISLNYPEMVKSVTLQGMTSCFGKVTADGNCDLGFDALKWFFSTGPMLKILGTELQHTAAVAAIKAHDTEETKAYFRYLSVATMTKTPLTWDLWNKEYYHNRIKNIKVPVLLLAGEHEHLIGFDDNSMSEDVKRIGKLAEYQIFKGFSHFMWWERFNGKSGLELSMSAMDTFYAKHF